MAVLLLQFPQQYSETPPVTLYLRHTAGQKIRCPVSTLLQNVLFVVFFLQNHSLIQKYKMTTRHAKYSLQCIMDKVRLYSSRCIHTETSRRSSSLALFVRQKSLICLASPLFWTSAMFPERPLTLFGQNYTNNTALELASFPSPWHSDWSKRLSFNYQCRALPIIGRESIRMMLRSSSRPPARPRHDPP